MENSFTVSPMIQKISLKAGETYNGYITVSNPVSATEDFSFKVSLAPYSVSNDNYKVDFEHMSDWSRIVEWTELDTTKGTLKPNDKARISFTINVPEDAPAGGQYLMLAVSSDDTISGTSSASIKNIYEMGSLVFAEIEGETKREGLVQENYVPGFVATGVPSTQITLKNDGNVHETAKTKIQIKNLLTGENYNLTNDGENTYETIVMPGTTRTVTRELENLPQVGIFEVTQSVSYLDSDSGTVVTMVICPIWFMALVLGVIISIIGMVCYGIHLKRKKAKKTIAI